MGKDLTGGVQQQMDVASRKNIKSEQKKRSLLRSGANKRQSFMNDSSL